MSGLSNQHSLMSSNSSLNQSARSTPASATSTETLATSIEDFEQQVDDVVSQALNILSEINPDYNEINKESTNNEDPPLDPNNYWIFGYGSLIYKPPPHTLLRVPGYITGYVRRFWQSSNDHRGTPEAPGRVVTLIAREFWSEITQTSSDPHTAPPDGKTWGVAYKIDPKYAVQVKEYLDYREKNGYTEHLVPFNIDEKYLNYIEKHTELTGESRNVQISRTLNCHVYIGKPDNEAFVGVQSDVEQLARHIVLSKGPSGENREYLYKLYESLKDLSKLEHDDSESSDKENGIYDEHVEDLVARARRYEKELEMTQI